MFTKQGDGLAVDLADTDRELLAQIPELLDGVREGQDDPAFGILHRAVHPDDPAASAEFSELSREEMDTGRRIDSSVVGAVGSGEVYLTRDEAVSLLRAVNDARLVLAARRGVFELDAEWAERVETDPALAAVAWLGYLQSELVQSLSSSA